MFPEIATFRDIVYYTKVSAIRTIPKRSQAEQSVPKQSKAHASAVHSGVHSGALRTLA